MVSGKHGGILLPAPRGIAIKIVVVEFLGVSIDFWHIFMHFYAFITGMDSFGGGV